MWVLDTSGLGTIIFPRCVVFIGSVGSKFY